jgi:hypothetical protein
MKKILAVGIITGLAAVSVKTQEGPGGCDGPVDVPGYMVDCTSCINETPGTPTTSPTGHCAPSGVGYRNDYTTCGGVGYDSCTTQDQIVGHFYPECSSAYWPGQPATAYVAYDDCMIDVEHHNRLGPCEILWCDLYQCAMPMSGGTAITKPCKVSLGEDTGCGM